MQTNYPPCADHQAVQQQQQLGEKQQTPICVDHQAARQQQQQLGKKQRTHLC